MSHTPIQRHPSPHEVEAADPGFRVEMSEVTKHLNDHKHLLTDILQWVECYSIICSYINLHIPRQGPGTICSYINLHIPRQGPGTICVLDPDHKSGEKLQG